MSTPSELEYVRDLNNQLTADLVRRGEELLAANEVIATLSAQLAQVRTAAQTRSRVLDSKEFIPHAEPPPRTDRSLNGKPVTLVCEIVDTAEWKAGNPFRWPPFHGLKVYHIAAYDALAELHNLRGQSEDDNDDHPTVPEAQTAS